MLAERYVTRFFRTKEAFIDLIWEERLGLGNYAESFRIHWSPQRY
jgi:hypothetical protein